jgi:hypothetical protein
MSYNPRLAIEAVVLVILFGLWAGVVMWFVRLIADVLVSQTVLRAWIYLCLSENPYQSDSADTVPLFELRRKAHASKESYYLNLLKECDESEAEVSEKMSRTADYALGVLFLSCVDLWVPLASGHIGILAQIADALGQNGYCWLFLLGVFLSMVAFYPLFTDRRSVAYCPELARELDEKGRYKAEKLERFRAELQARAASRASDNENLPWPEPLSSRLPRDDSGRVGNFSTPSRHQQHRESERQDNA